MKELLKKVDILASEELERAENKFGSFASGHEGYAIILEELEEAIEMVELSKAALYELWTCVKRNDTESKLQAEILKEATRKAAAEFIQTNAMAMRFIKDIK